VARLKAEGWLCISQAHFCQPDACRGVYAMVACKHCARAHINPHHAFAVLYRCDLDAVPAMQSADMQQMAAQVASAALDAHQPGAGDEQLARAQGKDADKRAYRDEIKQVAEAEGMGLTEVRTLTRSYACAQKLALAPVYSVCCRW
jgi:hypothetical protein